MKATVIKFLRFFGLDTLLLGLIEKLSRGLIKKLTAIYQFAVDALERVNQLRNGD